MVVELRGVEFINKGAELMYYAISQHLESNIKNIKFCMEPSPRRTLQLLRDRKIIPKVHLELPKGYNAYKFQSIIPSKLFGPDYIKEDKIHAVIDGSGFAFGDYWGPKKAGKRMGNHVQRWRAQGKKIILLPQAFGPFTSKPLIEKMKCVIDCAHLIFARDEVSFQYLKEIKPHASNIFLKPDFTNLVQGQLPVYFDPKKHEFAIIPNFMMFKSNENDVKRKYIDFLVDCITSIKELDISPYFLMHESENDIDIGLEVNKQLNEPLSIINESDPILVKGLIGNSKGVITSRFHGLVSSLSQSVPSLTTGWSHKYKMLLRDYDSEDQLVQINISKSELSEKIHSLIKNKSSITNKLGAKSQIQKELSKSMWEMVINCLNN